MMNNGFWVIFLALLTGCMIGYEIGSYVVHKRVSEMIDNMIRSLKEDTERNRINRINSFAEFFEKLNEAGKKQSEENEMKEAKGE